MVYSNLSTCEVQIAVDPIQLQQEIFKPSPNLPPSQRLSKARKASSIPATAPKQQGSIILVEFEQSLSIHHRISHVQYCNSRNSSIWSPKRETSQSSLVPMRTCEQLSKQGPMRTQRCFGHKSSRSAVNGTKCAANGV